MKLYLRGKVWWVTALSGKEKIQMSTGQNDYDSALEAAETILEPLRLRTMANSMEAAAALATGM